MLAQVVAPAHELRPGAAELRERARVLSEGAHGDGPGDHLHRYEEVPRQHEGAVHRVGGHSNVPVARAPAVVEACGVRVHGPEGAEQHVVHPKDALDLAVAVADGVKEVDHPPLHGAVAQREALRDARAGPRDRPLAQQQGAHGAAEKDRGGGWARRERKGRPRRRHGGHERRHERHARHDRKSAFQDGTIRRRDHREAALDAHRLVERGDAALEGRARRGLVVEGERLLAGEQLEGQPRDPGAVLAVVAAHASHHACARVQAHDARCRDRAGAPLERHEAVHEKRREGEAPVGGGDAHHRVDDEHRQERLVEPVQEPEDPKARPVKRQRLAQPTQHPHRLP